MRKPRIVITMGDPAGVGPEILLQCLAETTIRRSANFLVIGSRTTLGVVSERLDISLPFHKVSPRKLRHTPSNTLEFLPLTEVPEEQVLSGRPTPECGRASVLFFEKAVELVLSRRADAIVTCPINKKAIELAGYHYSGHTDILAEKTRRRTVMMLVGGGLRVALLTAHIPLREVPKKLSVPLVVDTIKIVDESLKFYFAIKEPRIALSALNPHASDGGRFGDEEELILEPASRRCRELGIKCTEPLPADSLFFKALRGSFDAVVAVYHDQGLAPLKMIAFDTAVNITLGLPFVRTSVDHGTAYDIAGKGVASHASLKEAVSLAVSLSLHVPKSRAVY